MVTDWEPPKVAVSGGPDVAAPEPGVARAGEAFLARLEHELHIAVQAVAMAMQQMHRADQHGGTPFSRRLQLLEAEIFASCDFKDRRLAATAQFGGLGNFRRNVGRDHNRAVLVGMNEIIRAHRHPGDANFATKIFGMNPRMRRTDGARQRLESRSPLRNVADRAIGNHTEASEGLVHTALHLAPERTEADVGTIDVLDYRDARFPAGAHIFVIGDATPRLLIGRELGL